MGRVGRLARRSSLAVIVGLATAVVTIAILWSSPEGAHGMERFDTCVIDFPVGPPDALGYYDAQPFGQNEHLGSDWNGNGGGDSDLGDAVHAIADGRVVLAEDLGGGWGNVVRIEHACGLGRYESISAHLDAIVVSPGMRVVRGEPIGTIGTANGQYVAHLHLELRTRIGAPIGAGYGDATAGQLDPTAFIAAHRGN